MLKVVQLQGARLAAVAARAVHGAFVLEIRFRGERRLRWRAAFERIGNGQLGNSLRKQGPFHLMDEER